MLLKWLGDKGWASLKPVLEPIEFPYPETGTRLEKADAVLNAMATGVIPADVGALFLRANDDVSGIEADDVFRKRLEEIEKKLGLINE